MRILLYACLFFCLCLKLGAQTPPRQLAAKRTTAAIKIDGDLDESIWKETIPATKFVEWRPTFGVIESEDTRTEIYIVYDNTSIYVAGYCHEKSKDSISKELVGRDRIGVNDYVGVIFDTYYDKINGFGFYVTPLGEQYDAKYSTTNGEDDSWSAVWDSEAEIRSDGWTFEMRIPYSALRFSSKDNQTWGINITRNRKKVGRQFMWNPVNPQINGFVNQEGEWTGIEKIEPPLRLSFSPYLSGYVNHYQPDTKDWRTSINGGMDVKYGISKSFTLDMTLIPDFGQVPSDPQVLNLTPFEVKLNENRSFFTEGTELFSKGNLFYSRRIGSRPIYYYKVGASLGANEKIVENPSESKLVNATKISGRTKKGLGIGLFNAVTKPMHALIEDSAGNKRKMQTALLTNYNIIVFDQTLKNNSSVSFINTNVLRSGKEYDANVSAALFDFNNKKNTYNWNGKVSVSTLAGKDLQNTTGYSHSLGFMKTGGRFNFQFNQELLDDLYDISDMGYYQTRNFIDHYMWLGYKWTKPGKWFNQLRINYNLGHSKRFKQGEYQSVFTNINSNAQLKNLWWVGAFIGHNPKANDFYEAQTGGADVYKAPSRWIAEAWFESNSVKKYSFGASINATHHQLFKGRSYYFNMYNKYRFSDKFSLTQDLTFQPFKNNVGFNDNAGGNIFFALRDRITTQNSLSAKYSFNNKSGIEMRIFHYWSEVDKKGFFDLNKDGSLSPNSTHSSNNVSFNQFTIFAEYRIQFAPGSFINVVWKNENVNGSVIADHQYFKNLDRTLNEPHNNNLSIRILYYLDYLDFKKWKR